MSNYCSRCDRPLADDDLFDLAQEIQERIGADFEQSPEYAPFLAVCWSLYGDCTGDEVDWHGRIADRDARILELEQQVERLTMPEAAVKTARSAVVHCLDYELNTDAAKQRGKSALLELDRYAAAIGGKP